jgi:hypothetical protein
MAAADFLARKLYIGLTHILPRSAPGNPAEDAMELRVAAKSRFQGGIKQRNILTVTIDQLKSLDSLVVAKVNDSRPCLLFEEATKARRVKSCVMGKLRQRAIGRVGTYSARDVFNGGMQRADWNLCRSLKALPGMKKCIAETGIHQAGICRGRRKFMEKLFNVREVTLDETAAKVAREGALQKYAGTGINCISADSTTAKGCDPHGEARRLLHEHVFLRRKKPEEIATANFITPVAEQVYAFAMRYQVQFKLGVVVRPVCAGGIRITPNIAFENSGQLKTLKHNNKK